jgi:hypothetical protein
VDRFDSIRFDSIRFSEMDLLTSSRTILLAIRCEKTKTLSGNVDVNFSSSSRFGGDMMAVVDDESKEGFDGSTIGLMKPKRR